MEKFSKFNPCNTGGLNNVLLAFKGILFSYKKLGMYDICTQANIFVPCVTVRGDMEMPGVRLHPSAFSSLFFCFYQISLFLVSGLIMKSYRLRSTLVMVEWFLWKLWPLDLENFSEFTVICNFFFCNAFNNWFYILYVV